MPGSKGLFKGECFTVGCQGEAGGISVWSAPGGGDQYRCNDCNDAIAILVPCLPAVVWDSRLLDQTAYDAFVRRIVTMDRAALAGAAEPLLARRQAAYGAFASLADAAGELVARDLVSSIVAIPHLVSDNTITNFWVQYRWEQQQADGRREAPPVVGGCAPVRRSPTSGPPTATGV